MEANAKRLELVVSEMDFSPSSGEFALYLLTQVSVIGWQGNDTQYFGFSHFSSLLQDFKLPIKKGKKSVDNGL